jgi:hypothetical protein
VFWGEKKEKKKLVDVVWWWFFSFFLENRFCVAKKERRVVRVVWSL